MCIKMSSSLMSRKMNHIYGHTKKCDYFILALPNGRMCVQVNRCENKKINNERPRKNKWNNKIETAVCRLSISIRRMKHWSGQILRRTEKPAIQSKGKWPQPGQCLYHFHKHLSSVECPTRFSFECNSKRKHSMDK